MMDHVTRASVIRIAKEVHQWALDEASTDEDCLAGWCAIASAKLFTKLQAASVAAELRMWTCPDTLNSHVFVVVEEHIVDVTASQFIEFAYQPVVVMPESESFAFQFYQHSDVFRSVDELRHHQIMTRWPKKQVAYA